MRAWTMPGCDQGQQGMGSLLPGWFVIPVLRSQTLGRGELVSSRTQDVTTGQECDGLDQIPDRARTDEEGGWKAKNCSCS